MTETEKRQGIELQDGRQLAYRLFGDPAGMPAFYCHGFPSSSREAELLHDKAVQQGLRIISADRPGYGGSDPLPERTIPAFADDLAALADRLGIGHFRLLGVSGGGPYALACAARLAERIIACALVAPLGPIHLPGLLSRMGLSARLAFSLTRSAPRTMDRLLSGPLPAWVAGQDRLLDGLRLTASAKADRVALSDPRAKRILNQTIADALSEGGVGARQDLVLYANEWGIEPASVKTPIELWQGEADRIVPPAHAHWYTRHLSRCTSHLLPEEGHYSLPLRHAPAILRALMRQS